MVDVENNTAKENLNNLTNVRTRYPLYSCLFHSCIFHPCNFDRIAFSTPAFSVAPFYCVLVYWAQQWWQVGLLPWTIRGKLVN